MTTSPEKHVEKASEMLAVFFGFEPEQAERFLRDVDSEDVTVRIDWERGTTIGRACGVSAYGNRLAEHVRAFDSDRAPLTEASTLVAALVGFLRTRTYDEQDGEADLEQRANAFLERHPAPASPDPHTKEAASAAPEEGVK
jgi:hypothetical protein